MLNKGEMILNCIIKLQELEQSEQTNKYSDAAAESFVQRQQFKWNGKLLENDTEVIHQLGNHSQKQAQLANDQMCKKKRKC